MAKLLPIIIAPNKILREKSKDLNPEDLNKPEIQELLLDMEKTMLEKDGLGLAAPQIGKNLNIIVIGAGGECKLWLTLFLMVVSCAVPVNQNVLWMLSAKGIHSM